MRHTMNSSTSSLILVAHDAAIATVTLNRPDKLNAINRDVLLALSNAFASLEHNGQTRVVIVTGAGEKAFAAGADIAAMQSMNAIQAKELADLGHQLGRQICSSPIIFLAAVQGFALGGGCELALACDLIYASDTAKFGQPEVGLGVIPGFGGTQRLVRRVGVGKARELLYTGEIISAPEAHRIGLCEAFMPSTELMPYVQKVATKIASKGPLAIAQTKKVMAQSDIALSIGNELEAQAFAVLFGSHDQKEGMNAFLEKRIPLFKNL